MINLYKGDCLEVLKTFPGDSVESLVTDPPAGIAFMNKEWDKDKGGRDPWIKWMTSVMTECLRIMKPGAHGLVWALPRTSHWTATALENAGFEVRDVITHLFGTGFPKSLNVEKAGAGQDWKGWGTALKPASEHWILIRKPIEEDTVAKNVLKWGTGAINIDASRIGVNANDPNHRSISAKTTLGTTFGSMEEIKSVSTGKSQLGAQGRFPANVILDEEAAKMLDEQSGELHLRGNKKPTTVGGGMYGHGKFVGIGFSESGFSGASRFFYVAKASTSERNKGLIDAVEQTVDDGRNIPIDNPFLRGKTPRKNTHPTVKSIKLMEYLIKLITPPAGIVLDPFMGSGSTGVACVNLGFEFVGIEKEEEYYQIAEKRLACMGEESL